MTKVINLHAGPGSGKSTTAAGLFYMMKSNGHNVELVTEFAKDKVWEESFTTLDDQVYVFAKQYHRLFRLMNKVDYIITDAPLLLSLYYGKKCSNLFKGLVLETRNSMSNVDIWIKRVKEYKTAGRMQNEEEAKAVDTDMKKILSDFKISMPEVPGDNNAPLAIYQWMGL